MFDISGWPALGAVFAVVVARDFLNYWQHRFDHRFVWPIHAVHHSQTDLHAANGYAHPFQVLSEFLLISIPLTLIGVNGVAVPLGVGILLSLQAVVIHSPTRVHLGPLRRVIVDHRFHRIHHSLEERHFDKNFGIVFSIWDQAFGTAYFPRRDEYPDVGLQGLDPPRGFWDYVLHPLRHWRTTDAREDSPRV